MNLFEYEIKALKKQVADLTAASSTESYWHEEYLKLEGLFSKPCIAHRGLTFLAGIPEDKRECFGCFIQAYEEERAK